MDKPKLPQNKKYILIAGILLAILIPLFIVIGATLIGGTPTNTSINTTNTNITANENSTVQNSTPTPNTLPIPLAFHNIIPGKTTSAIVTNILGIPAKIAHTGEYTRYYFIAKGTPQYNLIVFKNDIVQYMVEQKPTLPPLFEQYKKQINKKEDGVLYDANNDNSGFNLYTFSQNGIAFADNPDTNQTSQIHYFIPETYQTFLLSEGAYINFLTTPAN